ncbi:HNH endonuclease [Sphingobacterium bambusae]|uniref:HNH endonuclease n=1 Tax=Sphingobacterium bambusae TaxID=662858 RepID=A0ABW6BQH2_9SPHI|nr:HNH endonuclease [Sphingobacterium bambusae]WPL47902.1 HNH endonuclease [Sphingobacterium bambusae]
MKNGGAPHKPILLLSIIEQFEQGLFFDEHISIEPQLVATFKALWATLVVTKHDPIFALPFYHMRSEPFWTLVANPGCELWVESKSSMRSFTNLNTALRYAIIDRDLADLLCIPENRAVLRDVLLTAYFPEAAMGRVNLYEPPVATAHMLNESATAYQQNLVELKRQLSTESYQEEVYVRSGLFKREIPRIYHNTCAISGMRVDALTTASMIDACHIVPFSEGYNDTLGNGIALCPNLHRAFDRGLISLSDNYTVLVNKNFVENDRSVFNLRQLEGISIRLPDNVEHHPALENLWEHRRKFGY